MWNSYNSISSTSHSVKNISFTHKINVSYLGVNVKKAKTWKGDTLKISRFSEFNKKQIILL